MARDFMPILRHHDFRLVTWALIEPHEKQALANHGQSLERLAQRGGLSFAEAAAILEDRPWQAIMFPGQNPSDEAARVYLERLIAARTGGVTAPRRETFPPSHASASSSETGQEQSRGGEHG